MKKIIKIILIVLTIIMLNIAVLINTVQAVEEGGQITIYTKGYFDRIIKKDYTYSYSFSNNCYNFCFFFI